MLFTSLEFLFDRSALVFSHSLLNLAGISCPDGSFVYIVVSAEVALGVLIFVAAP